MSNTITLGGQRFDLAPMPWGRLKRCMAAINRVGIATSAGLFDETVLDEMASVLCEGLSIDAERLLELPTTMLEVQAAFDAVVRISGLEAVMEKALGEAPRSMPTASASTRGTPSTQT